MILSLVDDFGFETIIAIVRDPAQGLQFEFWFGRSGEMESDWHASCFAEVAIAGLVLDNYVAVLDWLGCIGLARIWIETLRLLCGANVKVSGWMITFGIAVPRWFSACNWISRGWSLTLESSIVIRRARAPQLRHFQVDGSRVQVFACAAEQSLLSWKVFGIGGNCEGFAV